MYPTPFQKKLCWAALTAVSVVAICAVVVVFGVLVVQAISYLQPLLMPVAISAILAFLLEPVVRWLMRLRISRIGSIVVVYAVFAGTIAGILIWIVPAGYRQGNAFYQNFGAYSDKAQTFAISTMERINKFSEDTLPKALADPEQKGKFSEFATNSIRDSAAWLQEKAPDLALASGKFLQRSLGGFLGGLGLVLSMILVPIFLFFFLKDAPSIADHWGRYLPLRASPLKSEIISLVSEINSYLISFFRGQLLVSLIDGALIGIALLFMGLDFALLIGLVVGVLGLIPYLGVMICWIPAVLIAFTQFGGWGHPLAVTIIFIAVNQLEGIFIAPKIVGEAVGLHPLTVILSVLAWSLILGGLLGALLAVPLTATIKVVLKRYFWDRPPSVPSSVPPPATS